MDFIIIPLISAAVAALTLVSGFGLGTLLLPAFAIFFPIEIAIAATAVVHLVNNLFRLTLVARWANGPVVVRFGVPALIAAFAGAALMTMAAGTSPLFTYQFGPFEAEVTGLKLMIAVILALFAGLELWPHYQKLSFPRSMLPIGGLLSGFFGGISGMQGALRAPFLLRAGLQSKEYVATANVISTIVDFVRLIVYAIGFSWLVKKQNYQALGESHTLVLVATACLAGFLGSYIGARMLAKVTLQAIRILVALLLFASAVALGAGVI